MSEHYQDSYADNDNYTIDEVHAKEKDTILLENATKEEDYQIIIDRILEKTESPTNSNIEENMKNLKKCLDEYFNHHKKNNFEQYFRKSLKQLNEVAIQYLNIDKTEMSLIILNECDLFTQLYNGYPDMQILTYNNLSCYFRKFKDQKRALKLLEKAETVNSKNLGTTNIGITFLNKSAILSEMGRHQEAIKCAKGAVMELKNQFEKAFTKKSERSEKKQDLKNFKNSMLQNSKSDDVKLEEEFAMREEESRQINQEFVDVATELGIAYHNLATEEQYFKLFDKSIKNFYNAYVIVKEYLGDNHPLTNQFQLSFETMNKKYQQQGSNNINEVNKQKKSPLKINESPEFKYKGNNSSYLMNTQTVQTMNSVEDGELNQQKEQPSQLNNELIERQYQTPQEQKRERKILKKQLEGTVLDYKQQMKAINPPVYNLLYNDQEINDQNNNAQLASFPNVKTRIEQYRQQYEQPTHLNNKHPHSNINLNNISSKKLQNTPQIYNYLYFDNNQEMDEINYQKKQQNSTIKQTTLYPNNTKAYKVSDLVDNASQCSESPRNNERRMRNLEIDQLLIRRNKSSSNPKNFKTNASPWANQKDRFFFDQGTTKSSQVVDTEKDSEKSQMTKEKNHPGYFLAKKMQGKYSKVSSVRPISAQEILSKSQEKKQVGGRKYKINPKLLIPDTIIEAANKYQDYLLSEQQSQNQKKNFIIKSSSQKNFSQLHQEKIKLDEYLSPQNKDYAIAEKEKPQVKISFPKQTHQKHLNIGNLSPPSLQFKIKDKKQGSNDKNFKQQLEQMREKLIVKSARDEQERQKPFQKWNFDIEPASNNMKKNIHNEKESMRSSTAKNKTHPNQNQGDIKQQNRNSLNSSQREKRVSAANIATEINQNYHVVCPYMNAVVKGKSDYFSIIKKGRLCCVFDEDSYLLIIAFQDVQLGQGVDIEDQSKLFISIAHLKNIFMPLPIQDQSKNSSYKYSHSDSIQNENELNHLKEELLLENLENLFKKFKQILRIDVDKKCLTLEQNFSGFTIQLKTPLHPKGIQTKIYFPHHSLNTAQIAALISPFQTSLETLKNGKHILIVEYPQEELLLQKENKKLEDLAEQFIILQRFEYATVSNKLGIIAALLNYQTQQIQFIFKSIDQQLDLSHYVVIEPLIQDYGSYFESQDTQIAINLLCDNLMSLWKYDGKNLTYETNKWSLKNEVEVPKQGVKKLIYQIVQQPSKEISLIQKKEVWVEVFEDYEGILLTKRDQLDKIDESHESEDESRQEKVPINKQQKKQTSSMFSQVDNTSRITNSITTNFQIVNQQEDEQYDQQFEDEYQQNKKLSLENSPNQSRKQSYDDNVGNQNKQLQYQSPNNQQQQSSLSSSNKQILQQKDVHTTSGRPKETNEKQNNLQNQSSLTKQEQAVRNQSKKNSQTSSRPEQDQYDAGIQKKVFDQLDSERDSNNAGNNLKSIDEQKSPQQNTISENQQSRHIQQESYQESNGGDSSKNNKSRNNSSTLNRPQSSKVQMEMKNNLSKGGITPKQNNEVNQNSQSYNHSNNQILEQSKWNAKNNEHNREQEDKNQLEELSSRQQNLSESPFYDAYKSNEQDNQKKRNSIRDRSEANNPRSRTNSLKPPQDQNKNNYSLNVSQEKEGDVEYIDINDTQQIYE